MNISLKDLIGAIFLTGALFLFWVLDFSMYNKISDFRTGVAERENTVQEYQAVIDSVAKLKQEYNKNLNEIQKFSAVIPLNKGTPELLSALDNIARQTGVQLGEVAFSPAGNQNQELPYKLLSVSLSARGGYSGLLTFLDAIEKNIRLLDVESADFNPDSAQPGSPILNLKIQANAYFLQ